MKSGTKTAFPFDFSYIWIWDFFFFFENDRFNVIVNFMCAGIRTLWIRTKDVFVHLSCVGDLANMSIIYVNAPPPSYAFLCRWIVSFYFFSPLSLPLTVKSFGSFCHPYNYIAHWRRKRENYRKLKKAHTHTPKPFIKFCDEKKQNEKSRTQKKLKKKMTLMIGTFNVDNI